MYIWRPKINTKNSISVILLCTIIFITPYLYLLSGFRSEYRSIFPEGYSTAMVLGAGIHNNKPSWVLRERLDTALAMYRQSKIKTILVSGSNQSPSYNEPAVMKKYLIDEGVPSENIVEDFGGRRSIDSCWRAKNVFKLEKVVLISQYFHLPRSNFLCKKFGLQTYPVVANDSGWTVTLTGYLREFPSTWQAFIDTRGDYQPVIGANGEEDRLE
jgi:SanA protein